MTPANERKAKERQAKRDAGLVRVEVWVKPKHKDLVQAFARNLAAAEAAYIQPHVGTFDAGTMTITYGNDEGLTPTPT